MVNIHLQKTALPRCELRGKQKLKAKEEKRRTNVRKAKPIAKAAKTQSAKVTSLEAEGEIR